MNESPLITVIVPVYNTEKDLRRCLDSVCNQTYKKLEIICVNDGSPDNSAAILQEYAAKDNRVIVVTQENQGLSAARNSGLDRATGDWVTGIDSDDYLELDAYESCLSAMADSRPEIVCFGISVVGGGKHMEQEYYNHPVVGLHKPTTQLLKSTDVSFCNKLFRRDFIKKHGVIFPVGLWFEDEVFFNSLAPYAQYIAYVPVKKYIYVQVDGGDNIMCKAAAGHPKIFDRIKITEVLLKHYQANKLPELTSGMEMYVATVYYNSLLDWLKDGSEELREKAWQDYRKVIQNCDFLKKINESSELYDNYTYSPSIRNLSHAVRATQLALALICSEKKIRRQYWKYRIKAFLSYGEKSKKNKDKRNYYKFLCRRIRAQKRIIMNWI